MKKSILQTFFLGMFLLFAVTSFAQVNVTGTVKSDEGELLPGVSIVEKGTNNGVVTDLDGNYSISVPNEQATLIFSFVGMQTQEVRIDGRSVIDVTLATSTIGVDEVVVTALGISREKKSLGYSVGEVGGEELSSVSQDNVINSLAGKVAGVQINQTGTAGSSVSVVIRGATSLTTDNQPLFVIDGVPMNNTLNNVSEMGSGNQVDYGNAISDLNADDIEEMTVLKGPGAAALYGTRAGNGVILITTKSGKKSKELGVSFSSNTLFEVPTKLLDFHYKYANGERNHVLTEGSAYWAGPELDAGIISEQWGLDEPAELKSYPDNMRDFLNTGVTSTNNIALTGGGDKGSFRVSYNNMSMQGMIPNHDRFNNSLKTSINYNLLDNLTFSSNVTIARTHSNDIPSTGDRNNNPLQAVYSVSHIPVSRMKQYWLPGQEGVQQNALPDSDNPYFIAYAMSNSFSRDRVYGNAALTYTFSKDFSVKARYSLDRYNEKRETKIPFSALRMPKGNYSLQNLTFQEYNADILATYSKKIENWDVSISGGGNIMNRDNADSFVGSGSDRRNGLVIPGLYTVSNIPLSNISVNSNTLEKAIYSLYALASIGFKNTVYIDITGRNDWSSTLPEENRSYFYPSASLSWLVNNTFELPESVSLFKLRGGWAKVGNDTQPYRLEPTLVTGTWNSLTTESVTGTLLNPNLKPEEATSVEGGIDLNMYNNRLRFSGTYYTVDNVNQIFSVPLPRSSGYSSQLINAGLIRSKGWEVSIGGTPISNVGGLNWDINFNFTNNSTTVEELTDDLEFIQIWRENAGAYSFIGDKIGDIYSYGIAQVEDPNSPYYKWPIIEGTEWVGLENTEDWEKVGNFNPDFMLGMQTSLSMGRWGISASIDWRQGGEFVSYTYRYGESDWKSQRQIDDLIPGGLYSEEELIALLKSDPERYIIPRRGNYPRVGGHTQETGGMPLEDGNYDGAFIPGVVQTAGQDTPDDYSDDVYVEHLGGEGTAVIPIVDTYPWSYNKNITFDASFIKLRELSISYKLPDIKGIKNATIALYTRNLMLWTAADIGIDPERAFQANGGSQGNTVSQFKQGFERQNVMPWSASGGIKLNFNF
ncbi:SusC/RagA family TonB-linked outer membrane protein [Maribellus maritimus]|uniref:SusC/RagA family TonB-linked outer membrane protein n=1 Tax=Maribellus maritimus TaxID=2870838 RepID=UPI001EEB1F80|nr:SusC/RagA family TonB-linked outer membrane protein [Maribellus maritimus]MCG6188059.1 SusC/RagA family TonB-linked outer membrane protein [Maribellus maritimus]